MSPRKRLQKIETSLPPVEAVLLLLKEMLELGRERYLEELSADGRNPRVVLAKMIGEALRENFIHPTRPELREEAVREAQKQGDMRLVLALNLHDYVRDKLSVAHVELLEERFVRLSVQSCYVGHQPRSWELWRAQLTERFIEKLCLKEAVEAIAVKYYHGHALLFTADEDLLNSQIACLQELVNDYNKVLGCLPGAEPIDVGALSSVIAENAELQIENFVVLARAKTLMMFGEERAADELLRSASCKAFSEIKRLHSLAQQQGVTC